VSGTPVTSAASASAVQAAAIDILANTIYDLQRQIHHIASGVGGYGGYSVPAIHGFSGRVGNSGNVCGVRIGGSGRGH
jgi:hypothetical protein